MPAGVEPCFNGHGTMQIDRLQQFLHLPVAQITEGEKQGLHSVLLDVACTVRNGCIKIQERLNLLLIDLPVDLSAVRWLCRWFFGSLLLFLLFLLFFIFLRFRLSCRFRGFLRFALFCFTFLRLTISFSVTIFGISLFGSLCSFLFLLLLCCLLGLLLGQLLGNPLSLSLLLCFQRFLLLLLLLAFLGTFSILSSLANLVVTQPIQHTDTEVAAQHLVKTGGKQFHLKDGIEISPFLLVLLGLGNCVQ
mmetsp:Transcript_5261/g.9450  ORF Transcript_5261/g.9450 Transcript_5261/m.9450 type:complete len:248 (+) Transcript_5261:2150-2893(+)